MPTPLKHERAASLALIEQGSKLRWTWALRRMAIGAEVRLLPRIEAGREAKRDYAVYDLEASTITRFSDTQIERVIAALVEWLWEKEKQKIMDDLRLSQHALAVLQALHQAHDGVLTKDQLPNHHGPLLASLREKGLITYSVGDTYRITDDGVDELLKRKMTPVDTPPENVPPEPPGAPAPALQLQPQASAISPVNASQISVGVTLPGDCADCVHKRILEALMEESPLVRRSVERMIAHELDMQRLRSLD